MSRSHHRTVSRVLLVVLAVAILYSALGLGFHLRWKSAQATCREERQARGEWVEPEVFGGALGLVLDVSWWPVYAWANIRHSGEPFATPCNR